MVEGVVCEDGALSVKLRKISCIYQTIFLHLQKLKTKNMKKLIDWYERSTSPNEKEYEEGCLFSFGIIAVVFIILVVGLLYIHK
jgi:hypothetical protein